MREAIKKEKPNKVSCDADELDIYTLQDSLAVFFQYPPHYPLIDIYSQSQQEEPLIVPATSLLVAMASMTRQFVFSSAFNCAFGCGLPVCCSRQDGNWTLEDEEAPVNRGKSKPITWCFVLSSFCNASAQIDVIVYNFLMYFCCRLWAFRTDCYGFTIPSTWVCVSAFSASCCSLTVMEFRGHRNKFWLSWGSVCCSVGWGCQNPLRASMWACM